MEYTNSLPYQVLTSLVFNGRSPIWCSFLYIPSQGWLNVALRYRSARLSVFLLFASLSLHSLSLSSSFSFPYSMSSTLSVHGFKANKFHNCLIPLPPPSNHLMFLTWSPLSRCHHQAHREWPLVLLRTTPTLLRRLGSSITSGNDSSTTSMVKLDLKFL